jgi:hypothetical protein
VAVQQPPVSRFIAVIICVFLAGAFAMSNVEAASPLLLTRPRPSAAALMLAQTTSGTLIGQIFAQNGSPLAAVKVTVVNENNGNTRATRTNQDGTYTVSFLTPGSYTITGSLDGYVDGTINGFIVPLNATTPLKPPRITLNPVGTTAVTPPATTGTSTAAQAELSPMINTTDPTRRANFDSTQVVTLPLGGSSETRTFDDLALLAPGVAPPPYTPGVRGPGVGFGIGTAGEFSVNGARGRSNNFTVDGSDNNDIDVGVRRQGFVALVPQPIESIQEFEISTLLWDNEQGQALGSQVNAVSKAGGNKYHGEMHDFFTDSRLNARNFFDYSGGKTPFTRNQAGLVFGGPIVHDKTQFFASFEHQDINAATQGHFSTPTAQERNLRLFLSGILGQTRSKFGVQHPLFNGQSDLIFATHLGATPLGNNIFSFYPLPNDPGGPYGANTYTTTLPSGGDGTIFSGKVTHQLNQKNSIAGRYNFTDDGLTLPSVNRAINSSLNATTRTQDVSLIVDNALTDLISNHGRFSYGRTTLSFQALPASPFTFQAASRVQVGSEILPSQTGPVGEVVIDPFSPVGVDAFTIPQSRASNAFQYQDSVAWNVRQHTLKFGAEIRRNQLNSLQDRNYRPLVEFGNGFVQAGNLILLGPNSSVFKPDLGSFLLPGVALAALGTPTSIFQTLTSDIPNSRIGLRFTGYNFFFNDSWRISPRLAINYGLRYEYNTVPHEVNNKIEDALTLKNLPEPGNSSFDSPDRTAAYNSAVNAYKSVLAGRTQIYDPDKKDFGPHFGFAWAPWADGRTSIRGGYGIYFDSILGAVVSQSRNVFPTEVPVNSGLGLTGFDVFTLKNPSFLSMRGVSLIVPGTLNQLGGGPQDFAALVGSLLVQGQTKAGLAFTLPNKHLPTPYAQQWHLTIEHELGRGYMIGAAYVGTKGTHLTRILTPNGGLNETLSIPFEAGIGQTGNIIPLRIPLLLGQQAGDLGHPRPISGLGAFTIFENGGSSSYSAFQVESRKRYAQGITFTAAYTWSHAIDGVSDVFPIAGAPVIAQDQNNLSLERGSANFDMRHRFALSFIWDLPFYRDSKTMTSRLLGGWQVSSIFQASSGQPFTLGIPVDANLDGNLTDRPSTENGLAFLGGNGRTKVAVAPGKTLADFFVLGQDGAVGRNTVGGANYIDLDMALNKNFRFSESRALTLRTEFFNALNRANFGLPIRVIGAPGFGSSVDTVSPGRIVQFALKFMF